MSDDVFSSDEVDDSENDVEIRFHYPDGQIEWHQVRAQETLEELLSVVRKLRQNSANLLLGDVMWRRRSLTSVSDPEEYLVTHLGMDSTTQLNVLRRAPTLSISLWMENGAAQNQLFKLGTHTQWRDVKEDIPELFCSHEPIMATAAAYTQELEYIDGEDNGHGIACLDTMKKTVDFKDAEYCYPIHKRYWLRISRRYLRDSSPLPSSQDNLPHIVIDNDTEFLKVVDEQYAAPVTPKAMANPLFVAFIEGVRADENIYWKLRSNLYLDPDTKEVYRNRWLIPGGRQCHVIALIRRACRPLRVPVPRGNFLEVFHRPGLRMKMEKGRVTATNSSKSFPDVEHWQVSYAVDSFTEDFTEASREIFSFPADLPPREVRRSVDAGDSITSADFHGSFDSFGSFDSSYCASV